MLTYLLTTSSLQEVILLKDNNIEDNIGVPCHPDVFQKTGAIHRIAPVFYGFLCGVWPD